MSEASQTGQTESKKDFADPKLVSQWLAEIKAYGKTYDAWSKQCKAIIKRYRNEHGIDVTGDGLMPAPQEFNVLWSNVQTLAPIVYSRTPKADISRKWKDRNIVGRSAATILERAVQSEIDAGGFDSAMKGSRDDYLLTARGQMWIRYVPTYGKETRDRIFLQEDTAEDGTRTYRKPDSGEPVEFEEGKEGPETDDDGKPYIEEGEPYKPVVAECVSIETVPWDRFGHTAAPNWTKVRGVWKGEPMTRDQLVARFGEEKGKAVPLKLKVPGISDAEIENYGDVFKRALVYEVWDKTTGKVLWIVDGVDEPLDIIDDPLGLRDFFPCPPPAFGTTTTDSLVPVPDFMQYRGQAEQIDDLTARIELLVQAVRVAGVYDGQIEELGRLLSASSRPTNTLIAVANWASLQQAGGLRGAMDFLPLEQVVAAITSLQQARGQLLEDVYQITGISDIVRGQAMQGPAATATEQRIKGQYAGLRISDRQLTMEVFARGGVQIVAEIVAEHFSPETLYQASGWEYSDEARAIDKERAEWEAGAQQAQAEYAQAMEEYQAAVLAAMQGQPMPSGENGEQPAPPEQPQPPEIPDPPPTSREVFDEAVKLLRDDRLRGFTIDIETDSMTLEDQQQEAQNSTDLLEKVTGYLAQALPAAEQYPGMRPLLGEMLLWTLRRHKIGRTMEAHVEQAWDSITEAGDEADAGADPAQEAALQIEGAKVEVAQMDAATRRGAAEANAALKQQKQQNDAALAAARAQVEQANKDRDAALRERELAEKAQAERVDRLLKMMELKLEGRKIDNEEKKNVTDAVIGAAQVDAKADAATQRSQVAAMRGETA